MLPLLSKITASILLNASTIINPTVPKALPFDASAFVTVTNQIRVSVEKTNAIPVFILLRNVENRVIYWKRIDKQDTKFALKLNVEDLEDGQYEIEIQSKEGSIRKQVNLSTKPIQQTNRVISMR